MTKLTVYAKKSKCLLCDDMKEIIYSLKKEFEFEYEEVNIENNKELYEKYKEKIPVLMINGKLFAKYRVNDQKLRRKMENLYKIY